MLAVLLGGLYVLFQYSKGAAPLSGTLAGSGESLPCETGSRMADCAAPA
jgi:hypothetical protein